MSVRTEVLRTSQAAMSGLHSGNWLAAPATRNNAPLLVIAIN